MKKWMQRQVGWALLLGLALFAAPAAWAENVYKCVDADGKTRFSSSREGQGGNCQSVELDVVQPNPTEVERQLQFQRDRADTEKKAKDMQKDADTQRREQAARQAEALAREPPIWARGRHGRRTGGRSRSSSSSVRR